MSLGGVGSMPVGDEKSDFDALMSFRTLTDAERLEMLFLSSRQTNKLAVGLNARLDRLNGSVQETTTTLSDHLEDHEMQQAGINYIKIWGARGTGVILVSLAILGGISAVATVIANWP